MNARQSPQRLLPGTVVTVQMKGLFKLAHHFALVTDRTGDDGLPMVIANAIETRGPPKCAGAISRKGVNTAPSILAGCRLRRWTLAGARA